MNREGRKEREEGRLNRDERDGRNEGKNVRYPIPPRAPAFLLFF